MTPASWAAAKPTFTTAESPVSANLSGILHQPLYNDLRALGLEPADAQHLHYAAHHRDFDFFVTLDGDFLSRRAKLEARCGGVRIVKPTKLVRLL